MQRLLFLGFIYFLYVGNTLAQTWTDAEFGKANTAGQASYLSAEEKEIIFFMNLSRLDGEKFFKTFLQDYIAKYNEDVKRYSNYNELKIVPNNNYYTSLRSHLKGIKNLPMFFPNERLTVASRNHALDLKRNDLDTHESSNGDKFAKRLSNYFPNKTMCENIDFGYGKALEIVCHLLLDCGVPSLGHRYTILDEKYNLNIVGVSIQTHPTYRYCTVIDFVAEPAYLTSTK